MPSGPHAALLQGVERSGESSESNAPVRAVSWSTFLLACALFCGRGARAFEVADRAPCASRRLISLAWVARTPSRRRHWSVGAEPNALMMNVDHAALSNCHRGRRTACTDSFLALESKPGWMDYYVARVSNMKQAQAKPSYCQRIVIPRPHPILVLDPLAKGPYLPIRTSPPSERTHAKHSQKRRRITRSGSVPDYATVVAVEIMSSRWWPSRLHVQLTGDSRGALIPRRAGCGKRLRHEQRRPSG